MLSCTSKNLQASVWNARGWSHVTAAVWDRSRVPHGPMAWITLMRSWGFIISFDLKFFIIKKFKKLHVTTMHLQELPKTIFFEFLLYSLQVFEMSCLIQRHCSHCFIQVSYFFLMFAFYFVAIMLLRDDARY